MSSLQNRDVHRRGPLPRCLRSAAVNTKPLDQHDRFAATVVLPTDELAARRERKRLKPLTPAQIQRLIVAAELRRKATEGERDE